MNATTVPPTWPVVGHDWAVDLLRRTASAGRPPQSLLVTGPPNVGKGTLVRALAQELLCTADLRPCGICRACRLVASGRHPDLYWISPEKGSLKIAQVRDLTRQLSLSPMEGPWQIAVLDQFELATAGAANALLKTLEEPPPNVMLALLAQQAEALLPTIVSRCQIISLRPIPRPTIEQALIERGSIDGAQAKLLSHICGGRLGWALSASTSPDLLSRRTQILDDLFGLLRATRVERFVYAQAMSQQNTDSILETLELWVGWWRDLLQLACRSPVALTNVDRIDELREVAAQWDMVTAKTNLLALQRTMEQISYNANTRLALEILLLDFPSVRKSKKRQQNSLSQVTSR
jgi:DNA polymerase-3 subunit delta'